MGSATQSTNAPPAARPTEGPNQPNVQGQTETHPLRREEMNATLEQQIDGMEQRMLEAVRKMLNPNNGNPSNKPNMGRGNQAKAVRSSGDVNVETERMNLSPNVEEVDSGFLPQTSMKSQSDWPSFGRQVSKQCNR